MVGWLQRIRVVAMRQRALLAWRSPQVIAVDGHTETLYRRSLSRGG